MVVLRAQQAPKGTRLHLTTPHRHPALACERARFVNDAGFMLSRRKTGLCSKCQHAVFRTIMNMEQSDDKHKAWGSFEWAGEGEYWKGMWGGRPEREVAYSSKHERYWLGPKRHVCTFLVVPGRVLNVLTLQSRSSKLSKPNHVQYSKEGRRCSTALRTIARYPSHFYFGRTH